jgi:hypothetical protein
MMAAVGWLLSPVKRGATFAYLNTTEVNRLKLILILILIYQLLTAGRLAGRIEDIITSESVLTGRQVVAGQSQSWHYRGRSVVGRKEAEVVCSPPD